MKTVIIGAGFAGMAAGIKTGATIYEATDKSGGICQSYIKDGFHFSNGGPHWIFGKGEGLEYIKSLVEVREYTRKAGVYYNHIFPYPFQNREYHSPVRGTFKHWLYENFGDDNCELFFYPFNKKYTAGLYDEIIPQDEYKSPKTGRGWVSTFCDPVNGLSDLVYKMASQCDIKYNKKVLMINPSNHVLTFEDGEVLEYDRLISTIPLNKCIEICENTVNLPYTSVLVINIGAEPGPNLPKEHWIYIPFCKSGFHRVAFYTNVDPSKAPEGKVGLSVEIAFRDNIDVDTVKWEVMKELQNWGWIGDIIIYSTDVVPCAYTWQYNREDVPKALAWLKERDIISTGRYGKWKFQGLTQSIEDGFNV